MDQNFRLSGQRVIEYVSYSLTNDYTAFNSVISNLTRQQSSVFNIDVVKESVENHSMARSRMSTPAPVYCSPAVDAHRVYIRVMITISMPSPEMMAQSSGSHRRTISLQPSFWLWMIWSILAEMASRHLMRPTTGYQH